MGLANRTYHQQGMQMQRPPSRLAGCPVTKWLLISNIAIFYVNMLFLGGDNGKFGLLSMWGHFSVDLGIHHYQVWRFITFQFLHADGMHLFGNMLGIFFFGVFAERWWGSKKFAVFYLSSGVAGALLFIMLFYTGVFGDTPSYRPLVGASAGIFAILVCTAVIAPNLRVLLFFFIPMSMRTVAIGALVFAALMLVTNLNGNAGGEAGHIGGAILGFILMKNPHLLSFLDTQGSGGKKRRRMFDAKVAREQKIRPRVTVNMDDSEIDLILDKVSREGIQSLTEEERELLLRASDEK